LTKRNKFRVLRTAAAPWWTGKHSRSFQWHHSRAQRSIAESCGFSWTHVQKAHPWDVE